MRRAPGQASIEEHPRGSGRYRVRARIEGRLRTVASGITLAEAEEAAAAYTVLRNEEVVREGVTVLALAETALRLGVLPQEAA